MDKEQKKMSLGKKFAIAGLGVIAAIGGLGALGSTNSHTSTQTQPYVAPVEQTAPSTQTNKALPAVQGIQDESTYTSNNYYTNVDGNVVHGPTNTSDGSVPSGATAQCGDGTYSFSQHHQGTCSHHEGVAEWL